MKLYVEGYGALEFPELTHKGIPQLQALAYLCPDLTVNTVVAIRDLDWSHESLSALNTLNHWS